MTQAEIDTSNRPNDERKQTTTRRKKNFFEVVKALSGSKNNLSIENSTGNFFLVLKENITPIGPEHRKKMKISPSLYEVNIILMSKLTRQHKN